jgi:hypothetical protein
LYQPSAFAAVVGAPESEGAVLSMLIPLTPALLTLSALSTADPGTDWFAPSVETVTEPPPVQLLMPDSASEHVKLTVTLPLFQPFAFGAGLREALMDGGVLSSLTVTDPLPAFPTLSVAVDVFATPPAGVFVCTASVAGVGPEAMPDPASVADHVIATSLLFQPAAFGVGDTAAVTVGPTLSRMYEACCVPNCSPPFAVQ